MSALRSLPPHPNLEFEHKEAKALLRRLRDGDSEALARAGLYHPALDTSVPANIRLADAQLIIAREYGFTSWPKLVRYFEDLERQRYSDVHFLDVNLADGDATVRATMALHRDRRGSAARHLAAYVPRFYGMRTREIYDSEITLDDARLAVARSYGSPSWEALVERSAKEPLAVPRGAEPTPGQQAGKAIKAADLRQLQDIVGRHPELLMKGYQSARLMNPLRMALHHERTQGEAMRPILEWLVSQGLDIQLDLNAQLCGRMRMQADTVRWLLDRGADPNWVAPNGIPVLEHALIRYWNAEAVDVLAERATRRKALWIAAGLGEVDGVREFLDADGRPTPAAFQLRPPFDLVGPFLWAPHPDPDAEEILMEAFVVAMTNGQTAVLEYMASRGTPVNSLIYGSPVINVAVGNGWTPVVESLVRCGADLDLRGWHRDSTARELAREMFEQFPQDVNRRRIVALCGMDPDEILAGRAKP